MLSSLVRVVLVAVVLAASVAFLVGYRWGGARPAVLERSTTEEISRPAPTSGANQTTGVDRARETGAAIGEKVAAGAEKAGEALDEARITAKIKSKIALDDTLKGSDVDVSTEQASVTVSGKVLSDDQRRRVLALARETAGVTDVTDHLSTEAR